MFSNLIRFLRLFVLFAAVLSILGFGLSTSAHAEGGQISGRITDSSGAPVNGATVGLSTADGCSPYVTSINSNSVSDANGDYLLGPVQAGSYMVQFNKSGYVSTWYKNVSNRTAATPVAVVASGTISGIDGVLGTGGKISGQVVALDGATIAGAYVQIYAASGEYITGMSTDSSGNYAISGFEAGNYKVQFSKSGFFPVWYSGALTPAVATSISISATESRSGINAVLGVGGKIAGKVTDVNGTPLSGVIARLRNSELGWPRITIFTDTNGIYSFSGLPTGVYSLQLTKSGYIQVNYPDTSGTQALITVTSPNTTSVNNTVMQSGGKITGKVTDSSGVPVSGVYVQIISELGSYGSGASTDALGNYFISGLATGSYKLQFSKSGYITVWHGGAADLTSAVPVSVTAPATTVVIDTILNVGEKISGQVNDTKGVPISGVYVQLVSATTGNYTGGTSTDSSGNYSFDSTAVGSYKLQFTKSGYITVWNGGAVDQASAIFILVTSPNTGKSVNIVMDSGGKISGRVTDSSGTPISGVTVSVTQVITGADNCTSTASSPLPTSSSCSSHSIPINGQTDASGYYTYSGLANGSYYVRFYKSGYISTWFGITADHAFGTPVFVTVPNTTGAIDAIMLAGGKITGHVVDPSGSPMSGVSVHLVSSTSGEYMSGQQTDASGNYSISDLATGSYNIEFGKSGYISVWYGGTNDKASSTLISVTAPATTAGINMVFGTGGKIAGQVTDSSGNPLAGVSVQVVSSTSGGYVAWLSTDSNGNYTISGLSAGSYKLQFSKSDYVSVWYGGTSDQDSASSVLVATSSVAPSINAVLGVGGKIVGQVTDSSGNPLHKVFVQIVSSATGGYVAWLTTDSTGNYSIGGLLTGAYKIGFSKSGYLSSWYGGGADQVTATSVPITSPSTTSNINGILITAGKISGRVTDIGGKPVSGVFVSVISNDTTSSSPGLPAVVSSSCSNATINGVTNSNGEYSYSGLSTGSYKIQFHKSGYNTVWYGGVTSQTESTTVTVTAPNATNGIDAILTLFIDVFPPMISIITPPNNMITNRSSVSLTGIVRDTGSGVKSLTVNDQVVTISHDYTFSCSINLLEGKNTVTFIALDNFNNQATDTRTITYDPTVLYPSGDLNGDGKVNVGDAIRALQISIGWSTATADDLKNGDVAPMVNGNPTPDGTIAVSDALLILRKAVGLITW